MRASQIKGVLLEYLVRSLLSNCGFSSVIADGLYTFETQGLFFVNGKGAAHDADVLMEPPIQIPFTYPSRVLFECKAYEAKTRLPVVRNALGLRYDINEFEIVTEASIRQRQNNRRADYAIKDRKRHNYQVGVASIGRFSGPAIEFAANNKIPLLSVDRFLPDPALAIFHSIDKDYVDSISDAMRYKIYRFLKDRQTDSDGAFRHQEARDYLRDDPKLGKVISSFRSIAGQLYVGLLETGDLIFLIAAGRGDPDRLDQMQRFVGLRAQIHYYEEQSDVWLLSVFDPANPSFTAEFRFFVPTTLMRLWEQYSLDRSKAIDIKAEFFSRIFIFANGKRPETPVLIISLDRQWLEEIRHPRRQEDADR